MHDQIMLLASKFGGHRYGHEYGCQLLLSVSVGTPMGKKNGKQDTESVKVSCVVFEEHSSSD